MRALAAKGRVITIQLLPHRTSQCVRARYRSTGAHRAAILIQDGLISPSTAESVYNSVTHLIIAKKLKKKKKKQGIAARVKKERVPLMLNATFPHGILNFQEIKRALLGGFNR